VIVSKPTLEKRSLADAFVEHNGPALATLIRILGDFDLAEDFVEGVGPAQFVGRLLAHGWQ